jgi:N-acetylmuramic acid 6-phosphate etherase
MDHPDFRVGGKIFATLGYPDEHWGMVKLRPEQQETFTRDYPDAFAPVKGGWGRQGATQVRLDSVGKATLRRAITEAYRNLTSHPAPVSIGGGEGHALSTPWSARMSPTEQRNPRSMKLDRMPLGKAIKLMLSEDAKVPGKLLAEIGKIEKATEVISRAFQSGGRLFYVGAGTSGRLGVLDASECPPTFRSPPEMVQGIIAGGEVALRKSVEGAEDDVAAGAKAIKERGVKQRDVVVGIAASGTTPFVWGALREAKRRKSTTVLVCFNPYLKIPDEFQPAIVIAPNLGPELLTGSTRLKAGTATKLLLNIFSTLAMVKSGKVASNLMVDLNPANVKLRERAVRVVRELTKADEVRARAALDHSGWVIKKAIARLKR